MVECCQSALGRHIHRFMTLCIITSSLTSAGCGTRIPPSPRGPDASILSGRDAVAPGERIEVFTVAGEHFAASVVSSDEKSFEISHKNPLDAVTEAHQDHGRVDYGFDETELLRTATEELESGDGKTTLVIAILAAFVVVTIIGLNCTHCGGSAPSLYWSF